MTTYSIIVPDSMSLLSKIVSFIKYRKITKKVDDEVAKWTPVSVNDNNLLRLILTSGKDYVPRRIVDYYEYLCCQASLGQTAETITLEDHVKTWINENCSDRVGIVSKYDPFTIGAGAASLLYDSESIDKLTPTRMMFGPSVYDVSLMFENPKDAILFKLSF